MKFTTAVRAAVGIPGDLLRSVRGSPTSSDTYLVTRRLHGRTAGRLSPALASMFRRMPGSVEAVDGLHHQQLAHTWAAQVAALNTDGVCRVPDAFTPAELEQLLAFATNAPALLTHADGTSSVGTYAQRGSNVTSVRVDASFVLAQPAVQAMLARAMAADIATARSGMWPTVHPPILYWSCVSAAQPDEAISQHLARRFHSDFDGLLGLRLHVYLTDVDGQSGPMDYVRKSHVRGALPSVVLRQALRRDTTDEIPEAEVRQRFGVDAVESVTGPAGTTFMSDSNGLHRGNAPVTGDRLFLVMALQAGSFAGAFNRVRRLPVVDDNLAIALRSKRPDLRLFVAATPSESQRVATLVV